MRPSFQRSALVVLATTLLHPCGWRHLALAACLAAALPVAGHSQTPTSAARRLYQITVAGRSGDIDSTGKTVIPPCFDEAWRFTEGLAVVQIRGLYGYIDTLGAVVIPPQFAYAEPFSEGLAVVGTPSKRYYIDRTGRVAIEPKVDVGSPGSFHNGRASASIGGVRGYIDRTGTLVIRSPSSSYNPTFSEGLAAMEVGGLWGFIDTTGTMVIQPQFPRNNTTAFGPGTGFKHGFAAVPIGGKWGFMDKTGRVVIPAHFDEAGTFEDGLARVRVGDQWGYIDTTGAMVIAPRFAKTWGFSEGLAAVRVSDKWGYIDRTGKLVIAAQFEGVDRNDFVDDFWGGIASVRRGDERGYIDSSGRFVWTASGARTATSSCAATLAQQPTGQVREDSAALPTVSPLPQPSGSGPQSDSTRPILYYEEVDGEPVLTGLFLDGRRVVMHADNGSVMIPMWSPDGAWAAYGTHDATGAGVLTVVNLRGERRNLLVARDSLPLHPRWSPDGRFIAAILMGTRDLSAEPKTVPLVVIGVVDAAVRSRVAIPASALGKYERVKVRWSPDGRRILVAGEMAVVATIATGSIDIIARQPVTTEWGGAEAVYYFAQSQSGRTLGAFYRRRLADRKPTQVASADQVARLGATESIVPLSRRVVVSPDGKRLALWGRASENSPDIVRLYDMSVDSLIDLEKPAATFPQAGRIMGLQWGPQGRGLAALVSTNEGLEIQYLEAASGQWRKLATVRVGGAADYYGFGILSLSWTQ